MLGQCLLAQLGAGRRCGSRALALEFGRRPGVVKNLGDMNNAAGSLRRPQQQIIMARLGQAGAEPPYLFHQAAAQDGEVADVVMTAERVRRPIRFKMWLRALQSGPVEVVLIGIHQIRVRQRVKRVRDFMESEGRQGVMLVEDGDVVSGSLRERAVTDFREVPDRREPADAYAGLLLPGLLQAPEDACRLAGRQGQAQLPVGIRLSKHRIEHGFQ